MEIKVDQLQNQCHVSVIGRLETNTSGSLEESLNRLETVPDVVLDFENLEYISSAGLRVLLATYKKRKAKQQTFSIIHINENVEEVFEITGFKKLFHLK